MGNLDLFQNPETLRDARLVIEAEINRLISLLDAFDGDCDLEQAVDEDREPDSDCEPDNDDEPWLGRLETISQNPGTYLLNWIVDGEVRDHVEVGQ